MRQEIDQFIESLEARNLSLNTVRAYQSDLSEFLAFLPAETEITRQQVRQYLVSLNSRGIMRSSVRRKLAAIKALSRWLAAEGLIAQDVAASIVAPQMPKTIAKWPSEGEIRQLVDDPMPGRFPERDRLIVHLLYATGIRVQELCGINLEDIQEPDVIKIRGKGKKERLVIFGECAQDALKAYLPIRAKKARVETKALFFGMTNAQYIQRLDVRSVSRILKSLASEKGLPPRHPHAFRHACATHMLDHGASIVMVCKLLGHANLSTTEGYTHISSGRMLQAYNAAFGSGNLRSSIYEDGVDSEALV